MAAIVVLCTVGSQEEGKSIAKALVNEKLAACVNMVPGVHSFYMYDGKFCEDAELMLVIKTRKEAFETLQQRISELHSYEVPEIIALDIARSESRYYNWLLSNVTCNTNL